MKISEKRLDDIVARYEEKGEAASTRDEVQELFRLARLSLRAESIIRRIAEYGPPQGEKHDTACPFCDMGASGYASRGDGFHDDDCAVKDAQLLLAALPKETD